MVWNTFKYIQCNITNYIVLHTVLISIFLIQDLPYGRENLYLPTVLEDWRAFEKKYYGEYDDVIK
jgi:hypothetical protein